MKVGIIGAGPAGLTAGLYSARARLSTVIFEKRVPGGLAVSTERIENYPGFPKGVEGMKLMDLFAEQAINYGAELVMEEITEVSKDGRTLRDSSGKEWGFDAVIIATGSRPRFLNVPGEKEFMGKGYLIVLLVMGHCSLARMLWLLGVGVLGFKRGIFS